MTSESTKEEQTMASEPMEVDKSSEEELAEAMNQRANDLYSCKNYKEALESYNKVVTLCPNKAQYYCNRAACYLMLDQYRDALVDAKKSLQLDPTLPKAYLRIIRSALLLGDVFEAETTLKKALEVLPNPDQYPIEKEEKSLDLLKYFMKDGENAYAAKDFRKVVYCMDRCLQVSPSCTTFKLMKAECMAYLGRYKEAERITIGIIHVDKQSIEAIYIRGMCLYYQDNGDRAIAHFQQVLRLAPDHVKAIEFYKKATSLKKKKEEGNAAFKLGKYQTAYNLYNEALLIDPKNDMTNAKLHFNKATVAAKLGKFEESVTECTEALKVDEQYVKALFRRASSYMELKQYEEAVRDLENACKMDESREYKRLLYEAKQALKKSKRKDYYKILGIDKNASTDDIKKAYRKRAKVHHPDRHPNSSEAEKREQEKKFKEVGEAYGILSDPKKRSRYDRGYDVDDGDNSQGDMDPMFRAFFGHPGGVFQFQEFDSSGCTFQFH